MSKSRVGQSTDRAALHPFDCFVLNEKLVFTFGFSQMPGSERVYRLPVNIFHFLLPQRFFLKGQAWIGKKGLSYPGTFRNIYCSRITVSPTSERYPRFIFPSTPNATSEPLSLFPNVSRSLFSLRYSSLGIRNVQLPAGSSEGLPKPSLEHESKLKKRKDKTAALLVCSPSSAPG